MNYSEITNNLLEWIDEKYPKLFEEIKISGITSMDSFGWLIMASVNGMKYSHKMVFSPLELDEMLGYDPDAYVMNKLREKFEEIVALYRKNINE